MKELISVELFAGGGGLALGLEQAGFNNVGVLENQHDACETLRKNKPNWNVIEQDITTVDDIFKFIPKKFKGKIDLLSGGYPCQSFSYAGKGLGLADTRGTLFNDFARILEQLQPKMFLVENVKGLRTHDKGNTLKTMIKVFSDLGYSVQTKVLNANDYGVAEKRERIFIVGTRKDLDIKFEYPLEHVTKPVLRDVIANINMSNIPGSKYPQARYEVLKQVPMGGDWRDLPEEVAKTYLGKAINTSGGKTGIAKRLDWNKPAPTLLTSPIQKMTERCHPSETRPLNILEYALIQSFPIDWKFSGSITSIYKQIGNAVPPNLAKEVGLSIKKALTKQTK